MEAESPPDLARLDVLSAPQGAAIAGKRYRLGRIFAADGRSVVLPVDHGLMFGRLAGLEDPAALVHRFLSLPCDGFLLGPGLLARTSEWFASRHAPARLLTLDSYWRGPDSGRSVRVVSLQRAIQLGVDAVKVLMPWDVTPEERARNAAFVADVLSDAEPFGLPVMVEPICLALPRGPAAVALEADGCRMAAELGADIIKVAWPGEGETLARWAHELGVPLLMLGGPAGGSADELCAMVAEAVAAGAAGITIGRRVWQRPPDEAAALVERLAAIVHPEKRR
jgi:class I fructose-bisphosphate aldolase